MHLIRREAKFILKLSTDDGKLRRSPTTAAGVRGVEALYMRQTRKRRLDLISPTLMELLAAGKVNRPSLRLPASYSFYFLTMTRLLSSCHSSCLLRTRTPIQAAPDYLM
ncbi:hypothetical protein HNY73_012781 [Argiope bruennichi]|uniref:Uncharacterized protein n=1 Tax=Argiope bruennichi TaxID=94029 RepID=A0A8T0EY49_ARGBR|nr:hypothetical protein HNY73_012781 [Argiope bruennichi]